MYTIIPFEPVEIINRLKLFTDLKKYSVLVIFKMWYVRKMTSKRTLPMIVILNPFSMFNLQNMIAKMVNIIDKLKKEIFNNVV